MIDRLRGKRLESYEEMRQRLIHATSAYLPDCLQHPELIVRIPMMEARAGRRFPPSMTASFWDDLLDD